VKLLIEDDFAHLTAFGSSAKKVRFFVTILISLKFRQLLGRVTCCWGRVTGCNWCVRGHPGAPGEERRHSGEGRTHGRLQRRPHCRWLSPVLHAPPTEMPYHWPTPTAPEAPGEPPWSRDPRWVPQTPQQATHSHNWPRNIRFFFNGIYSQCIHARFQATFVENNC